MKSTIKSRFLLFGLALMFALVPASVTGSGSGQHHCRAHCDEVFYHDLHACQGLPKPERQHCEERAREHHRACLHHCVGF